MATEKAVALEGPEAAHARAEMLLTGLRGTPIRESVAVQKIRQMLQQPVTLEFVDTPLGDVRQFLTDFGRVNIVLDRMALEKEAVINETPFTINVQQLPLASAIKLLLESRGLTYEIRHECLVITSQEAAEQHYDVRVHSLAAIPGIDGRNPIAEWEQLLRVQGSKPAAPEKKPQAIPEGPEAVKFIEYYAPTKSLVVFGPASFQKRLENLLSILKKAPSSTP